MFRQILVNPITSARRYAQSVYLPPSPGWYDFWTEKTGAISR